MRQLSYDSCLFYFYNMGGGFWVTGGMLPGPSPLKCNIEYTRELWEYMKGGDDKYD